MVRELQCVGTVPRAVRRLDMYISKAILLVLFIAFVVVSGWAYWFVTAHGFSAREKPTWYETLLARHARRLATDPGALGMKNPVPLTPLALAEARDHYADHCAICHANDGSGNTMIGRNLYPPAPDMRNGHTQELSDGEIFQIIRNGIRFTGMPGWGGADHENWKLVLFIRHLPKLTPEERKLMNEINELDEDSRSPAKVEGPRSHH